MASDQLNEVGKYIKKTRTDSDYALKKIRPYRPTVERTRDIFDVDVPFSMQFEVKHTQKSVSLDLEFNKPPPQSNCMTDIDCPRGTCETYTLSSGEHEITLEHGIHPINELLQVYVNGELLAESQYAVLSKGGLDTSAVILVTNLPLETNTVVICYMIYCLGTLYTGRAFGALLRNTATEWQYPGDQPPAGWYKEAAIGPIHYEGNTIVIEQSMYARVEAYANYALVPGRCITDWPPGGCDCSVGVIITAEIQGIVKDYLSWDCGLYYVGGDWHYVQDLYLPAGTRIRGILGVISPAEAGGAGWGNQWWEVNESWIRVGRLRSYFPDVTDPDFGYLAGIYGYWDGAEACTQGECF
jgi:hypothetical protein